MAFSLILIFCFLFVIYRFRDELIIDWKRNLLMGVICVIPFISWLVNREIIAAPENAGIQSNVFLNYVIPQMLLFFGLYIRKMNPYLRGFILILGVIWFGYMMLHDLIGFHNPLWENLGL